MSFDGLYDELDGKSLDNLVGFGKMSALTVKQAIDKDAGWVKWAVEKVDHFQLNTDALSYLSKAGTAKVWRKGDILPFGKHKGSTVLTVLRSDASYLLWCFENLPDFDMDDALVAEAHDYKREQEKDRVIGSAYGDFDRSDDVPW